MEEKKDCDDDEGKKKLVIMPKVIIQNLEKQMEDMDVEEVEGTKESIDIEFIEESGGDQ